MTRLLQKDRSHDFKLMDGNKIVIFEKVRSNQSSPKMRISVEDTRKVRQIFLEFHIPNLIILFINNVPRH